MDDTQAKVLAVPFRSIPTEEQIAFRVDSEYNVKVDDSDPNMVAARVGFYVEVERQIEVAGAEAMMALGMIPGTTHYLKARAVKTQTYRPWPRNISSAACQFHQMAALSERVDRKYQPTISIGRDDAGPFLSWEAPMSDLTYAREIAMLLQLKYGGAKKDQQKAEMAVLTMRATVQQALDAGVDPQMIYKALQDCADVMNRHAGKREVAIRTIVREAT